MLGRFLITGFTKEFGGNDAVEENLAASSGDDCIGEFIKPYDAGAIRRVCRDQRGLGIFGIQIGDNRARIRNLEIAIAETRHFAERAASEEIGVGITKADGDLFEFQPLFSGKCRDLAHKGR